MGVKKVSYDNLSKAGKWMRNNPSKVKSQPSRNEPLSAKDKRDKVESQRERRRAKKQGRDIKDKDWDHTTGKFESVKANRGAAGTGGRIKGKKHNWKMKLGSKNIDSPTTFRQDSPLKDLGFTDTATASQQAYSSPSVAMGGGPKTPLYDRSPAKYTAETQVRRKIDKAKKEYKKQQRKAEKGKSRLEKRLEKRER